MSNNVQSVVTSVLKEVGSQVDAWDLRIQFFGIVAYFGISDSFVNYIDKCYEVDYTSLEDDDEFINENYKDIKEEQGYFFKPSLLWDNYIKEITPENAYGKINQLFTTINSTTSGKLINLFENWKLKRNITPGHSNVYFICIKHLKRLRFWERKDIGLLYEALLFSDIQKKTNRGGEYFTPSCLGDLMVSIVKNHIPNKSLISVYDPTCGSGSLLLRFLNANKRDLNAIKVYGQEINPTTVDLCNINMLVNGLNQRTDFSIEVGDTLLDDKFPSAVFDVILSNPPYNIKWIGKDKQDLLEDPRFKDIGVLAPKTKADWAFISHALYHLSNNGIAAILVYPGILYRSAAEEEIRKWFIDNNFIDAVIDLPGNLFSGTSIAVCMLVLRKNKEDTNIKFIDASSIYVKQPKQNILSQENIEDIVKLYTLENPDVTKVKVATIEEIKERDYQLIVQNYIPDPEDKTLENFDPVENYNNIRKGNKKLIATLMKQEILMESLLHCKTAEEILGAWKNPDEVTDEDIVKRVTNLFFPDQHQ